MSKNKRMLTGCENQTEIDRRRGKKKGKFHIAYQQVFEEQAFLRIDTVKKETMSFGEEGKEQKV